RSMDGSALSGIDALPNCHAISKHPRAAGYRGSDFVQLALGGKSQHCNNFGSYGYYKRRGERVDFMPGCDPKRSNACVQAVSIAALRLRKSRQKNSGEVGKGQPDARLLRIIIEKGTSRRAQLHLLQYCTAEQAVWIAKPFHHLEVVVAFHDGQRHRFAC